MGFIDRVRSQWIEISATAKVARNVPKLLPMAAWNSARYVEGHAERIPNNLAIAYLDERHTWRDVQERSNQYADFFTQHGIGKGDKVALLMDNRPDFLFVQTGLNRIRAVGAFINTNLTGKALAHAINVAKPKAVLAGSEHWKALSEVWDDLEGLSRESALWLQDEEGKKSVDGVTTVNAEVASASCRGPAIQHKPKTGEGMCYIYTSGTTGLPKAAVITNQRWLVAATLFGQAMHESTPQDIIYVSLPLYHSSAQFAGWGPAITTGAAVALRRKFSATNFWKDVREFHATRFVYIGELCRYLMNQPVQPGERDHQLKLGVGNGLRPDIWEKFQDRFGVPLIREFYGATEGNAPLVNVEGRPGMVGRLRPGQLIAKCDLATGELIRNGDGLATKLGPGGKGLMLGQINAVMSFDGYLDKAATQKKILRDVLKKGDKYFNTGDILQLHEDGWVSFVDRVGDTFRWKGENVSTNEVAEIINGARGVLESNVYGVKVEGAEGRAGMASINASDEFDVHEFAKYVTSKLANYQRPYFIRVQKDMRITGTFKHQKVDYRDEAYDPAKVKDPLYYLDGEKYVPIDAALYKKLSSGEVGPR
ncbi:MAG: long-chain-acyl-CoA synthetase [Bdellovibrionota bacterium]